MVTQSIFGPISLTCLAALMMSPFRTWAGARFQRKAVGMCVSNAACGHIKARMQLGCPTGQLSAGGVSRIMTPTPRNPTMTRAALVCLLVPLPLVAADPPKKPVAAIVESSLKTAGGQVRQLAFDGDAAATYFASDGNPGKDDHFTLRFDGPVM